jgi:hypothetical protein
MKRLMTLGLFVLAICFGVHLLYVYSLKDQCDLGLTPDECASLPDPKILGIWKP